MTSLFAGLTAANLIVLLITFALGLSADATAAGDRLYPIHMAMGFAAGIMVLLTHLATYMYFMATTKWLAAASDKVNLDFEQFVRPAEKRKRRVFAVVMSAIVLTMLAMFAGAGADPAVNSLWPTQVHLMMAALAIAINILCAAGEYQHIRAQGQLMDDAIEQVNGPRAADGSALP